MDDPGIIDITTYLGSRRDDLERAFGVWGGDGDRARLALPTWRALFLLGGNLGGILWRPSGEEELRPFFMLDLAEEPARTECPHLPLSLLKGKSAPEIASSRRGGVVVFLGVEEEKQREWYLGVQGMEGAIDLEGKGREELLFLAGECAGLLFFWELAGSVEP